MLNERKLVERLDRILKREFGTNLAFHEFSAGYGIADLVLAANFSFTKKVIDRTPLTSFASLQLLLTLENQRQYSFTDLLVLFPNLSAKEIKKHLKPLTDNEYLTKTADVYLKNLTDEFNPIRKVIAIEVKLNDHKGGLVQARRYRYFADESYLAILKEAEKNIDFDEFNKHNIGLILFDEKNGCVEIRYPRSENNHREISVGLFAKEMMLSKYISSAS